jgi:hypothetical protein
LGTPDNVGRPVNFNAGGQAFDTRGYSVLADGKASIIGRPGLVKIRFSNGDMLPVVLVNVYQDGWFAQTVGLVLGGGNSDVAGLSTFDLTASGAEFYGMLTIQDSLPIYTPSEREMTESLVVRDGDNRFVLGPTIIYDR